MKKGKLIVLEGIDGSGKSAQYRRLCARMEKDRIEYNHIVFPRYDQESSALIRMYLGGEFGEHPDDVNACTAATFFAVDRFASYRTDWGKIYNEGGIILSDRYTTSNAVHQCSKLPEEQWDTYLDWLFRFEYEQLGIPVPDAVIYLRVDPAVSQKLMTARYHGDEGKKDIHESDVEYLCRSRLAAEYCAEKLGWQTVSCTDGDMMRPVETIHAEILQRI